MTHARVGSRPFSIAFSHVSQSSEWEHNEHFSRVSSRIEPAYLINLREHLILFSPCSRNLEVPLDYSPPHSFVSLLFPAEGMRRASESGWTVPEQSKRVSKRVKGLWNDTNGLAKRVLNTVHSGSPAQVPGAAGQARGRKREKRSLKGGLVVLGGGVGEGRGHAGQGEGAGARVGGDAWRGGSRCEGLVCPRVVTAWEAGVCVA